MRTSSTTPILTSTNCNSSNTPKSVAPMSNSERREGNSVHVLFVTGLATNQGVATRYHKGKVRYPCSCPCAQILREHVHIVPPAPSTTATATLLLHSIDEGIVHQTDYWPNIWPTLNREQNLSHCKCESPSKFTVLNPHYTAGVARVREPRLWINFCSNLKTQMQIRTQT